MRNRPWVSRIALAVAVSLAAIVAGPAAPQAQAGRYTTRRSRVAAGVVLSRISDARGPNQMRLLTVDPSRAATFDVALSRNSLSGFETVPSMAKRHGAVAAINGDFGLDPGRPVHAFAEDGELMQTAVSGGNNFAISEDEQQVFVGPSKMYAMVTESGTGNVFQVDRWNVGAPAAGEIVGYTERSLGAESTPGYSCQARLLPSGGVSWAGGKLGVERSYVVDTAGCFPAGLDLRGGLVLAAAPAGDEGVLVRSLRPGSAVTVRWSPGWPGVLDMVGGAPVLVSNGAIVAPRSCWDPAFCARNPRTGIGVTATGKLLLLTVDGRDKGWSVGMTLVGFARQFKRLGAVYAINLDGGGSTTMWVKGKVVNVPSDGSVRSVSSAVLILPDGDIDEPLGPMSSWPMPADDAEDAQAWARAVNDPGSTGGLFDAMVARVIEPEAEITATMRDVAGRFRSGAAGR